MYQIVNEGFRLKTDEAQQNLKTIRGSCPKCFLFYRNIPNSNWRNSPFSWRYSTAFVK
jgi:hypothetical protein